MSDATLNDVLPTLARRRTSRRRLLARAATAAGVAVGSGWVGATAPASADTLASKFGPKGHKIKVKDTDILNLALNLEYLEAEYYQRGALGLALGTTDVSGNVGTQGVVTGGAQVIFSDPVLQQYFQEVAADELAHVRYLRAALGEKEAVVRPSINFTDAFNTLGERAGILDAQTGTFDPFSSAEAFMLGAFFFEDVGVTAYQGLAPYIGKADYLKAAAGILAVEGYHAGMVRTALYRLAQAESSTVLTDYANKISAVRQTLSQAGDSVSPTDEGLAFAGPTPNIVPTTTTGLTYPRSIAAVLNIVYLGGFDAIAQAGQGGFFPNGLNGRVR